jgi:hypothetical protein
VVETVYEVDAEDEAGAEVEVDVCVEVLEVAEIVDVGLVLVVEDACAEVVELVVETLVLVDEGSVAK